MKKRFLTAYRHGTQLGVFLLYNAGFLFSYKYCPVPGLNCYACPLASFSCPIGSLQHFMVLKRFPFLLLGFFILIGSTVGRMVCGWACPAGLLQDLLYKIPVKKVAIQFPPLRFLQYGVLFFLVLFVPFFIREPLFCRLCFMGTIQGGIPLALMDAGIRSMVGNLFYIKLAITGVFLLTFLLIKRPFCRFFCPLGAVYGLFNRVSFLRLHVGWGCTKCNECARVCPVDIRVYEDPNSSECIRCLACTSCVHVQLKKGGSVLKKKEVFLDG